MPIIVGDGDVGGTTATAEIAITEEKRQGGGGNGRTRAQMALNIFYHRRLPWEEEEGEWEGEGDQFANDCCLGSTPFGNQAKR